MPHPPLPLAGLTFSLSGAGRVGSSLAAWAVAAGGRLEQVASRAGDSARSVAARLGGTAVAAGRLESGGEDLLLVAVADAELGAAATALAARKQARVVLHTSGSHGASALAPLAGRSAIGAFHPLKAFPHPLPDIGEAREVLFALDGEPSAMDLGRRLAAAWGGVSVEVREEDRLLYHLAASLAAGGVVTLLAAAGEIAERAGLPPLVAAGYRRLAAGALAATGEPAEALTGPVARGDGALVGRQIAELARRLPELVPTVAAVARETLRQRRRAAPLDPAQTALLQQLKGL